MNEVEGPPSEEQIRAFEEQDSCPKRICVNASVTADTQLSEYRAHLGEAWLEYRRLWLRWFEERVERRYAKKREREVRQRLNEEIRAGRILGESE